MSKIYWLNKEKINRTDMIRLHKMMEDAGAYMGSDHQDRLESNAFNYNFCFNPEGNKYMAALYFPGTIEHDDVNFEKSPQWFFKFVENGFINPDEVKFIDNSDESSTETFLDKQLKTINN
jgi:hypothetical protein